MAFQNENILKLNDGRKISYAEYGDPKGIPCFLFHGNPGSRLLWGMIPGSPFLPKLHLVAPDRPGYGRTDFKRGVTTLENWPNDVAALADHLGIDKFAVFGPSGGGPYALACAWKIPHRLTKVGLFASVGPYVSEALEGLAPPVKALWEWAPRLPLVFRIQMILMTWFAKKYPMRYSKMVQSEFGNADRQTYARLNLGKFFQPERNEAYRQHGIGTWYDCMIPSQWPIPLEEIKTKVYLWQGEEDISVPLAMGHYLANHLPNCEALFIKGAGHFWLFEHLSEMLEALMNEESE